MKTDSLFYRLLQAQPTLAFELAGLDVPEPTRYGFISQEVKQTAFRLEGIAEPPADRPDAPRGYIEVQFQPDEDFYQRFFSLVDRVRLFAPDILGESSGNDRAVARPTWLDLLETITGL